MSEERKLTTKDILELKKIRREYAKTFSIAMRYLLIVLTLQCILTGTLYWQQRVAQQERVQQYEAYVTSLGSIQAALSLIASTISLQEILLRSHLNLPLMNDPVEQEPR
jgi:uncharacterized membrane protein YidH (DUF202 family)